MNITSLYDTEFNRNLFETLSKKPSRSMRNKLIVGGKSIFIVFIYFHFFYQVIKIKRG